MHEVAGAGSFILIDCDFRTEFRAHQAGPGAVPPLSSFCGVVTMWHVQPAVALAYWWVMPGAPHQHGG